MIRLWFLGMLCMAIVISLCLVTYWLVNVGKFTVFACCSKLFSTQAFKINKHNFLTLELAFSYNCIFSIEAYLDFLQVTSENCIFIMNRHWSASVFEISFLKPFKVPLLKALRVLTIFSLFLESLVIFTSFCICN